MHLFPLADPGISKRGGGCPGAVELSGSGDCFDVPLYILYVFVGRIENEIHIVKYMCVMQSKCTKTILPFFSTVMEGF